MYLEVWPSTDLSSVKWSKVTTLELWGGSTLPGVWTSHARLGWWEHYLSFWICKGRLRACTGCFNGTVAELLDKSADRHKPTDDHPGSWLPEYAKAAKEAEQAFRDAGYQFTV